MELKHSSPNPQSLRPSLGPRDPWTTPRPLKHRLLGPTPLAQWPSPTLWLPSLPPRV
jgi:hypothetical protein